MEKVSLFSVKLQANPWPVAPRGGVEREMEAVRETAVRHRAREGNRKANADNRPSAVIVQPVPLRVTTMIAVSLRGRRLLPLRRLVRRATGTVPLADLFFLVGRQDIKNLTVLKPGVSENHGIFLVCG
jgi:hypothetical protein